MPALALGLRAIDPSLFSLDVFEPKARQKFEAEASAALLKEFKKQRGAPNVFAQVQDASCDDIDLMYGQFYWVVGRSKSGSVFYLPDMSCVYKAHSSFFDISEEDRECLPVLDGIPATVDYRQR